MAWTKGYIYLMLDFIDSLTYNVKMFYKIGIL